MKIQTLLFSALIFGLTACNSGGPTYITAEQIPNPVISVSATGSTAQTPDTASVSAGVVTQGKTAGQAMRANAEKMNRVFTELKAAGILDKNIQTSQLSLQPRYDYSDRRAPKIQGYEARNTVSAKTEDLDGVGPMLDALVVAAMADAAGVRLGKLQSLSESSGGFRPQPLMAAARSASFDTAPTPVAAGEQTLSVTINMTYSIIE